MFTYKINIKNTSILIYLYFILYLLSYSYGVDRDQLYKPYGLALLFTSFSLLLPISFIVGNMKYNYHPVGIFLFILYFIFLSADSLFIHSNYKHLFYGSLTPLALFFLLIILFKLRQFSKMQYVHFFCQTIIIISIITFFFGILSYILGGISLGPFSIIQVEYGGSGYRLVGWWGSPNTTSTLFALSILCLNYLKLIKNNKTFLYNSLIILMIIALLLTGSRGAILSLIFGYLLFRQLKRNNPSKQLSQKKNINLVRNIFLVLVFMIFVASIYFGNIDLDFFVDKIIRPDNVEASINMKTVDRPFIWFLVYDVINSASLNNLLFGHGPQYFMELTGHSTHNDYLSILTSYGLLLLIFWMLFLVYTFIYSIRNNKRYYINTLSTSVLVYLASKAMLNHTFPGYGIEGTLGMMNVILIFMNYEPQVKSNNKD